MIVSVCIYKLSIHFLNLFWSKSFILEIILSQTVPTVVTVPTIVTVANVTSVATVTSSTTVNTVYTVTAITILIVKYQMLLLYSSKGNLFTKS